MTETPPTPAPRSLEQIGLLANRLSVLFVTGLLAALVLLLGIAAVR